MAWSKEKRAEYMKRWRAEHKEHVKEYQRRYRIKHFWDRKYYPPDPVKQRQRTKDYYEKHKHDKAFVDKYRAANKRWLEQNRDRWNEYQREYARKKRAEVQV